MISLKKIDFSNTFIIISYHTSYDPNVLGVNVILYVVNIANDVNLELTF